MPKKILVIDDEPHLVDVLANRLKASGYEVVTAVVGREGLEKAMKEKPGLILLDVLMPDLDGFQVLRALKGAAETQHIPVMILTVKKWGEDIQKMMTAGAIGHIVKPFDPKALLKKIEEVFKNEEEKDPARRR